MTIVIKGEIRREMRESLERSCVHLSIKDWHTARSGRFGIGETNNGGLKLLEFAKSHRLTFTNTLLPPFPQVV